MPCGSPLVSEMSSAASPNSAGPASAGRPTPGDHRQDDGSDLEAVVEAGLGQRLAEAPQRGAQPFHAASRLSRPRPKYSRCTVSKVRPMSDDDQAR